MATERKKGRPVTGNDVRNHHTPYFLTDADYDSLTSFAKQAGFRSLGQMTTGIMESLLLGGFTPEAFFKLAVQIKKFAEENGAVFTPTFYFGQRPESVIPVQEITGAEMRRELAALRRDIEKKQDKEITS